MSETPAADDFRHLVDQLGIRADSRAAALGLPPAIPDLPRGHTSWLVTLSRGEARMTVPWYQHRPGGAYDPPSAHAVLFGLMRDVESFEASGGSRERWALAHGFEEDDRGAWQAYADLGHMAFEIEALIGDEYGTLQHAARLARREIDRSSETGVIAADPVRRYA